MDYCSFRVKFLRFIQSAETVQFIKILEKNSFILLLFYTIEIIILIECMLPFIFIFKSNKILMNQIFMSHAYFHSIFLLNSSIFIQLFENLFYHDLNKMSITHIEYRQTWRPRHTLLASIAVSVIGRAVIQDIMHVQAFKTDVIFLSVTSWYVWHPTEG
jgi:hypothetical protein